MGGGLLSRVAEAEPDRCHQACSGLMFRAPVHLCRHECDMRERGPMASATSFMRDAWAEWLTQ